MAINRRELLRTATLAPIAASITAHARQGVGRLVLVHGRGQAGKDPNALKREWLDALRKGLPSAQANLLAQMDVSFPFYGDALQKLTTADSLPLVSDIERGTPQDDELMLFQSKFLEEVALASRSQMPKYNRSREPNPLSEAPSTGSGCERCSRRSIDTLQGFANRFSSRLFETRFCTAIALGSATKSTTS